MKGGHREKKLSRRERRLKDIFQYQDAGSPSGAFALGGRASLVVLEIKRPPRKRFRALNRDGW